MKHVFVKTVALVLSLVMMLALFTACGSKQDVAAMDAVVDAAVKAALEAAVVPSVVTIVDTDGRHITIEDANGKSLQQLLDQANIFLEEKDFLTLDANQMVSGNITIQVVRSCTVTVVVSGENSMNDIRHTVMLAGGTVADAIAAARIELGDTYSANYALHEILTDGMEIVIFTDNVAKPEETEPEETEPTEATEPEDTGSSNNSSNNSNTGSNHTQSTAPKPTEPAPTEPKPTEPAPTEPERTVVSVEVYEDCDGSGHGVKVITYSDGTQEEVYF